MPTSDELKESHIEVIHLLNVITTLVPDERYWYTRKAEEKAAFARRWGHECPV